MAQPQIRPGAFTGAARISGSGSLVYSIGVITSINRIGVGIYEIGFTPSISSGEHTFKIQPILGFAAEASGSVNVEVSPPLLQTVVGGVAADLDCYLEVTRVRTVDGTILPSFPPVPSVAPPPSAGDVTGPSSSTDEAIVRFDGVTGKIIQDYTSDAPTIDDTGNITVIGTITGPTLIGGVSPTSDLTLKTTSGVGAAGADMHFLVGNNGAIEAMNILNNGRVGIGTSNPGALLDVIGSIHADGDVIINDDQNGQGKLTIKSGATSLGVINFSDLTDGRGRIEYDHSGDSLALFTLSAVRLSIDSTGDVGIGTTSPQTNLHIQESNTDTVPGLEIEQLSTGDAALQFSIVGNAYAVGIDNNDADKFKISYAAGAGTAVLGTNDRFVVTVAGDIELSLTGQLTTIKGLLQVDGIAKFTSELQADGGIGRSSAGVLSVGADFESTSLELGKNTTITKSLGEFQVAGPTTLSGNVTLGINSASTIGLYGVAEVAQSAAYTRNAAIVEDRTLLASASATALNNNNVIAALIADLQALGAIG